jgi:hypothetical protein
MILLRLILQKIVVFAHYFELDGVGVGEGEGVAGYSLEHLVNQFTMFPNIFQSSTSQRNNQSYFS